MPKRSSYYLRKIAFPLLFVVFAMMGRVDEVLGIVERYGPKDDEGEPVSWLQPSLDWFAVVIVVGAFVWLAEIGFRQHKKDQREIQELKERLADGPKRLSPDKQLDRLGGEMVRVNMGEISVADILYRLGDELSIGSHMIAAQASVEWLAKRVSVAESGAVWQEISVLQQDIRAIIRALITAKVAHIEDGCLKLTDQGLNLYNHIAEHEQPLLAGRALTPKESFSPWSAEYLEEATLRAWETAPQSHPDPEPDGLSSSSESSS